jgi:hypothetical protein
MVTKQDFLNELAMCDKITCTTTDDYRFDAGVSNNWIGGSDNGFMCDLLGNIEYSSAESLACAIFSYLENDNLNIAEID